MQRLRQADPSWLRSGQTTTLFSSDTEKEPVSEARGGIPSGIYPRAGPCEAKARWWQRQTHGAAAHQSQLRGPRGRRAGAGLRCGRPRRGGASSRELWELCAGCVLCCLRPDNEEGQCEEVGDERKLFDHGASYTL